MRVVIQRVTKASVTIEGKENASIGLGLLILLGIEEADDSTDLEWLVKKTAQLRIFADQEGVMNKSVMDVKGGLIVVSQFTLHANTKKGNRPSYIRAARPEQAIPLYEKFVEQLAIFTGISVGTGIFAADMKVELLNDGPVTIIMDSKNKEL